ncbi:MAG: radical SAM protein [Candidatus Aenigmatarchaeota archaeon]
MKEKVERLVKWASGRKAPPLTLELNITNKCNLLCRMCWLRSKVKTEKEMEDEMLLRIVEEAIDLDVKEFRFPGSGEPLMRKEILFRLMEKIKENGRTGLLISNGTLFSEEDVKKLVEMEWDVLTISLDGPSARINDYIRGVKGAFRRTLKTLSLIKKWKKKLSKTKPWLRMNVVLTNKNYDKIFKIVELANHFDLDEILLQPITIFSKEGEKLKVKDLRKVSSHIEVAMKKAEKFGIKTNFSSFIENMIIEKTNHMEEMIEKEIKKFENEFLNSVCYEPFYNLVIMPNGKIGACAVSGASDVSIHGKNLKKIWFGGYLQRIRKNLLKGVIFPFCSHCCVPIFLENKRLREELAKVIE